MAGGAGKRSVRQPSLTHRPMADAATTSGTLSPRAELSLELIQGISLAANRGAFDAPTQRLPAWVELLCRCSADVPPELRNLSGSRHPFALWPLSLHAARQAPIAALPQAQPPAAGARQWWSGGQLLYAASPVTTAYFDALFRGMCEAWGATADRIGSGLGTPTPAAMELSLDDLFHGHVFSYCCPRRSTVGGSMGTEELGIIFHAKERPLDLHPAVPHPEEQQQQQQQQQGGGSGGFTSDDPSYRCVRVLCRRVFGVATLGFSPT